MSPAIGRLMRSGHVSFLLGEAGAVITGDAIATSMSSAARSGADAPRSTRSPASPPARCSPAMATGAGARTPCPRSPPPSPRDSRSRPTGARSPSRENQADAVVLIDLRGGPARTVKVGAYPARVTFARSGQALAAAHRAATHLRRSGLRSRRPWVRVQRSPSANACAPRALEERRSLADAPGGLGQARSGGSAPHPQRTGGPRSR